MSKAKDVTASAFQKQVLDQAGLVLVDLWAPWCAPCRAMAPVLDDIADDFGEELTIRKIDIDTEGDLRDALAVKAIPTLILYREGKEVTRATGAQSRARLTAWIEAHL